MLSQCQVRMRQLSRRPVTASGHGGRPVDSCPADKLDLRSNLGPPMPKASNRPASPPPPVRPPGEQGGWGSPLSPTPFADARAGTAWVSNLDDMHRPRRSSLPRVQNINSNHRHKFERHVGHFPAREAQQEGQKHRTQVPGRTLSSGCRRPQEKAPPLGKEARPNQRGRNMGLARGVDGPSLRLLSWEEGSSGAVQCSAVHLDLAVGVSPTCRKMHVRWALGKQRDPMEGGKRHHSLSYRKSGRVVVVVLGRLGLISLAGGER